MSRYAGIIERLEKAEGPDRDLDGLIAEQLGEAERFFQQFDADIDGVLGDQWVNVDGRDCYYDRATWGGGGRLWSAPHYTASLDVAVGLVERVLPDFKGWFGSEHRFNNKPTKFEGGLVVHWGKHGGRTVARYEGRCANHPIAILLALFHALQSQENSSE